MTKSKGMSLLELMISCALLTIVSGAIVLVFQTTMREYRHQSMVSDTLKSNSIALTKISEEIMKATAVYCPDAQSLTDLKTDSELLESGFKPLNLSRCLAFKINIRTITGTYEERLIGYYLDTNTGQIKRVIFNSTANENPATWIVSDPATQISVLGYIRPGENFSYNKFTFKFDKAYRSLSGHSPEDDDKQVMVIAIAIKRTAGSNTLGDYPLTTKVWLERNTGIYYSGIKI